MHNKAQKMKQNSSSHPFISSQVSYVNHSIKQIASSWRGEKNPFCLVLIAWWSIQTSKPGELSVFFLHQNHGPGLTFCFILNQAHCLNQLIWLRDCSSSKPKNVIMPCISSICDLFQWTRCDRPSVSHFPPLLFATHSGMQCGKKKEWQARANSAVYLEINYAAFYALHCASQALLSSVSSLKEGKRGSCCRF